MSFSRGTIIVASLLGLVSLATAKSLPQHRALPNNEMRLQLDKDTFGYPPGGPGQSAGRGRAVERRYLRSADSNAAKWRYADQWRQAIVEITGW